MSEEKPFWLAASSLNVYLMLLLVFLVLSAVVVIYQHYMGNEMSIVEVELSEKQRTLECRQMIL